MYRNLVWLPLVTLIGLVSAFSAAGASDEVATAVGPAEVISDVTADVMSIVAEANTYFESDPERYYREIDNALASLVDWRGFATAVMGQHYSRGKSLDQLGRQALKAQRDRFAVVLREGLIQSYAKGLLAFGGAQMEVMGAEASPESTRIASVTQAVYGEADRVYTIRYQMGQYRDGTWKLRNLIIETINLGEIYRNQFSALAQSAEGDLDLVIDRWNATIAQQAEDLVRD